MEKVIIGIHGLANKPEEAVLTDYWKSSIAEGLSYIDAAGVPFDFQLVYWADRLYRYPMHEEQGFEFDGLYNNEPYLPANEKPSAYEDGWTDELRRVVGSTVGSGVDWLKQTFGVGRLADALLGKKLKDLDYYYDNRKVKAGTGDETKGAKEVLRDILTNALAANSGSKIMLISHSMGSIIAYDVLRVLGHSGPKIPIKHFVTIGSPLGLPHVKQKIVEERKTEGRPEAAKVRTPTLVTHSWTNFADRLDPVAADSHLSDDFGPNDLDVQVTDDLVRNEYVNSEGEHNHHKSYGYLRTPELAQKLKSFLEE